MSSNGKQYVAQCPFVFPEKSICKQLIPCPNILCLYFQLKYPPDSSNFTQQPKINNHIRKEATLLFKKWNILLVIYLLTILYALILLKI